MTTAEVYNHKFPLYTAISLYMEWPIYKYHQNGRTITFRGAYSLGEVKVW